MIRATAFISSWTPRVHTITIRWWSTGEATNIRRSISTIRTQNHYPRRRFIATMQSNGLDSTDTTTTSDTGIVRADLRKEMTRSYMEYAMSVILGRAMPDVRDGLKPVHRRIIYAMHELGLVSSSQFRKSARVVGEVLGKYHPHGDTAVYDALVRMAQPFSMSIPLINGHGNFGSTDGDPAAAMRYTECKLSAITTNAFLSDMDRDTVAFAPNFDGSEQEPLVLPVKVPNLLVNGSAGIAVGMATNIPPHNLAEVVSALVALIENPNLSDERLMELVPAPDFPTGGQILGVDGAKEMYKTGKGRVLMRACAHAEVLDNGSGKRRQSRDAIVVTELPYQVNKAILVAKIAELVNEKKLDGVSDLRDESDRNGTRIVIELKRDAKVPVVLNNLYKKTQLQSSFAANVMALDSGRFPLQLTLRQCLEKFLNFRRDTVRKRVQHDLKKAEARLHLVDGLLLVQRNVDRVVANIRESKDTASARQILMQNYSLSELQTNAVLEMQLRRLTSLEHGRLESESEELRGSISECRDTLSNNEKLDAIISTELRDTAKKYGTQRRSKILLGDNLDATDINELSLTSNERSAIMVTKQGYIKRLPTSAFESQNRGTRGKRGVGRLREGDKIAHVFSCMSHDSLIAVSVSGVAYSLPAYKVPEGALGSRGVPIFQLLPGIPAGETMAAVVAVTEQEADKFLAMVSRGGFVKKTKVKDLLSINSRGKIVVSLEPGDELRWVKKCGLEDTMVIGSKKGQVIRFLTNEKQLRASGRNSRGVKSIRLREGDEIADMDVVPYEVAGDEEEIEEQEDEIEEVSKYSDGVFLLAVTAKGTGKRISANAFRSQSRGGSGVRGIKLKVKKDKVVALQVCHSDETVMLVTKGGNVVRTKVGKIPIQSRSAQGVKIQRLESSDSVAAVAIVPAELAAEDEDDELEEDGEEVE